MAQEVSLRETYGDTLAALGKDNRDIVVLGNDLTLNEGRDLVLGRWARDVVVDHRRVSHGGAA